MTERLTQATINIARYRHNLSQIQRIIGDNTAIMAVIKANAYGHGIERIAQAAELQGVEYLGVISIGELRQVRQCGVQIPCLIINYLDESSIHEALSLQGSVTAMDESFIRTAQEIAAAERTLLKVHLKIDSGMHRAGCNPKDAAYLAQLITNSSNLILEGVFTHFAESNNPDQSFTRRQLDTFQCCITALAAAQIHPRFIHAANSGAILTLPESNFSMVRAGIISYGLSPLPDTHPLQHNAASFLPALQLHSHVTHVRIISEGETVGYDRSWRAQRKSTIALVAVGYGDGFCRGSRRARQVIIRGKYATVVGAVSMDQITVDVTDLPEVTVGDTVTIIGEDGSASIAVSTLAQNLGTIQNEVLTNISARVERRYVDSR